MMQGMKAILDEFAAYMKAGGSSESEEAGKLVKKLQKYITDNFYTCTDQILAGLGEMYVADD